MVNAFFNSTNAYLSDLYKRIRNFGKYRQTQSKCSLFSRLFQRPERRTIDQLLIATSWIRSYVESRFALARMVPSRVKGFILLALAIASAAIAHESTVNGITRILESKFRPSNEVWKVSLEGLGYVKAQPSSLKAMKSHPDLKNPLNDIFVSDQGNWVVFSGEYWTRFKDVSQNKATYNGPWRLIDRSREGHEQFLAEIGSLKPPAEYAVKHVSGQRTRPMQAIVDPREFSY